MNHLYVQHVVEEKLNYRKILAWEEYRSSVPELDHAFFGDSHAHDNIFPIYYQNAYNFGEGSEIIHETYYKVRYILETTPAKNIVLEVDPHSFTELRASKERFNPVRDFKEYSTLSELAKEREANVLSIALFMYAPVLGNFEELFVALLTPPEKTVVELGWHARHENYSTKHKYTALDRIESYFTTQEEMIEETSLEALLRTIELANKYDAHVTLLVYPHLPGYDAEMQKQGFSLDDHYTKLLILVNETGADYTFLNYFSYFEDTGVFADPDHLNVDGVKAFAEPLSQDLAAIIE